MIIKQLWFNGEMLPDQKARQKGFYVTLPQIYKWGINAPISIGAAKLNQPTYGQLELKIIILGFGFIYNENWDN